MAKRILAALLTAALLLSSSSCGIIVLNDLSENRTEDEYGEDGKTAEETAENEERTYTKYDYTADRRAASERYLSELPERDYDGAVFFVTSPSFEYFAPDDTGSVVSKLSVEKNARVEELLGITLITSVADENTMLTELSNFVASGSYYTDLLMIPIYSVGNFRISQTLINMRNVPFFDIDAPYFNRESSDMTSGGYTTYGVAGDACISPSSFSALFMNKSILTEAGLDTAEIYRTASSGGLNWDFVLGYAECVSELNEGTGKQYRTFTAQNTAERLPDLIFKSSGNDYILTGTRTVPTVGYTTKSVKRTMANMAKIYGDTSSNVLPNDTAISDFADGKSAFLIDYLYVMPWMTNASADWGVLPLPKEMATEEYRTLIANTESVFAIPVNHTNPEYAAITLSALNAAAYGYIYDEYTDYSLVNVLRDNDSANMLDIIFDSASFDFALAFGNAYPTVAQATYRLVRDCAPYNNIGDYYSELAKTAKNTLKTYFDLTY